MPRDRQRVKLQDGLKLDLNNLIRKSFITPGTKTGPVGIQWRDNYWDQQKGFGHITANMSGTVEGWFRIDLIGGADQWITLVSAFSRKVRHASEWRLTEHPCDVTG